ncbi:MAG TPA: carboxypeptidase regulatory-like domain-containing protein [Candidatus Sulfotelmatobacter sp.]|nr:carboxypeptidase regulatory-like domain-containing protein [Candidatus Sulfotelmatobacter sp.]
MMLQPFSLSRNLSFVLALCFVFPIAARAQAPLLARVELTRNGYKLKDASNAVLWLTPVAAATEMPPQQATSIPKLIQRNKSFHPSVIVVPVGGKVEFPNQDPFFHNVFSMFEGKRFDLGLYESGSTRFVQFDKPGISFIFCNIHAEMSAVVIALSTPYYAVSDARGEINLPNVPPGRYKLEVFHSSVTPETLRSLSREVTVAAGDSTLGTFTLTESGTEVAHKNKYGLDYDPPDPDSPAYARP